MKLNGRSNQSQSMNKGEEKSWNQQNSLGFPKNEIEYHGDKNKSKKETGEKNFF